MKYSRFFKYILKKHGENIDNPSIRIYINKVKNKIKFKSKHWILS